MKKTGITLILCALLCLSSVTQAEANAPTHLQGEHPFGGYRLRAISFLVLQLTDQWMLPQTMHGVTLPAMPMEALEALQSLEKVLQAVIDAHPDAYAGIDNPLLQETLALLRYPRYGGAASPPENLLWSGAAGVPAAETLTLASRPELKALQETEALWQADFIHMLAVLDVYLSRPLTPRANPNGRVLSFGGDLLTAGLSESVPPSAIGTEDSGYFSRQDLLADLHGTLLAIFCDTYPEKALNELSLSELLLAYEHYYQPNSLPWRLQWTIALESHFGSIESLCQLTADELGLDPSTDSALAQRLEVLRQRLYGY